MHSVIKRQPKFDALVTNSGPLTFIYHLSLLLLLSFLVFWRNPGRLFIGNDGPTFISLAKEQFDFFGISLNLHSNLLEGLANLSLPINLSVLPQYWFPMYNGAGIFAPAATYSLFAAQWFATILLVGWNYGFSRQARYVAAWLLTLLMFPYFPTIKIYQITATAPHFVTLLLAGALIDVSIWRIGAGSWRYNIGYAILMLSGVLIVLIALPPALVLIVPFLCISGACSLRYASSRLVMAYKFGAVAALLVLSASLGWLEYVAGLSLYSAAGSFLAEMLPSTSSSLVYVSIFFQGYLELLAGGIGAGFWLFVAAFLGSGIALFDGNQRLRYLAIMLLLVQALFILIGIWFSQLNDGWSGPAPIYFETPIFSLYGLFAVYFIFWVYSAIAKLLPPVSRLTALPHVQIISPFVLVAALIVYTFTLPSETRSAGHYALPPASTSLTQVLEKEIAIRPGMPFAGRVANVQPGQDFWKQVQYSSSLNTVSGNDHQTTGLWLKNIPTLHEYNQIITPAYYRIVRDFLAIPTDKQYRSWTNFSKVDPRIFRLLGVRFLLSSEDTLENTTERAVMELPSQKPLRLFELNNAKIAGISAVRTTVVHTIDEAEAIMHASDFEENHAVLFASSGESLLVGKNRTLVSVDDSQLTVEKGAFRLRAKSKGLTMLILPIEYSHCLSIETMSGETPQAQRVDIALTGLLFDREVDVRLVSRIGPFTQPRCRWQDYLEFRAILQSTAF